MITGTRSMVQAPLHHVGESWTYEGIFEYDPEPTKTIVVSRANESGYLFTATAEEMLVYEAMWGDPLLGEHDLSMARVQFKRDPLDFPLSDGKSWGYSSRLNVTAHVADITTPRGSEKGFVIGGSNDDTDLRYEYSPSIGAITLWHYVLKDGTPIDDYKMTRAADAQKGIWYEAAPITEVSGPDKSTAFDVPAGYDAVVVSAGGSPGGRAIVQGPDGSQYVTDFNATGPSGDWHNAILSGAAGKWIAAAAGHNVNGVPMPPVSPPVGWAYIHVAPVRWIRS